MGIFEILYYLGYSFKKYYSIRKQKKLPHRVISIGNITSGGTGKTPAAIAVAEEAKRRGFQPIILTRGYRGKAKGPCLVKGSNKSLTTSKENSNSQQSSGFNSSLVTRYSTLLYGDEPVLMATKLKDVPVIKCADRYKGGMFAIENLKSQTSNLKSEILFILDDGFQHWRLFRDRDVMLIDAENPFDSRRLLPVGLLREPLKAMCRADIIVITKADRIQQAIIGSLIEEIKQYNPEAPIFLSGHKPSGFIKLSGEIVPVESAEGKKIFAFCGIGNPESFRKTILAIGGTLTGLRAFRDHHMYSQLDIDGIIKEAESSNSDWIVTTEKDIMRTEGLGMPENIFALEIKFQVDEKFYSELFLEN